MTEEYLTSLTPLLSTVQASNKDSHGLICRTGLEFIIGTLPFVAPTAFKLIGRTTFVAL